MTADWEVFLHSGEEWVIAYSCAPDFIAGVKLFAIGHAFELHLKAVHSKLCGDVEQSIRFGHKIVELWQAIKQLDPAFLPEIELRQTVLDTNILKGGQDRLLSKEDFLQFLQFQELYLIAKHLPDLKYLGAPLKTAKGQIQYAFAFPNPMWAEILRSIRCYLGKTQKSPILALLNERGEITDSAAHFLDRVL